MPITARDGIADARGCLRADTTAEALAGLKSALHRNGSVTAGGTASPLTDGAAPVCGDDYVVRNASRPLARIRGVALSGCRSGTMGLGRIPCSRKVPAGAGIEASAHDVVAPEEAFASQAIACMRALGRRPRIVKIDRGAIAIGDPPGAAEARVAGKAAVLPDRRNGRCAPAIRRTGGGQGIATVLEHI